MAWGIRDQRSELTGYGRTHIIPLPRDRAIGDLYYVHIVAPSTGLVDFEISDGFQFLVRSNNLLTYYRICKRDDPLSITLISDIETRVLSNALTIHGIHSIDPSDIVITQTSSFSSELLIPNLLSGDFRDGLGIVSVFGKGNGKFSVPDPNDGKYDEKFDRAFVSERSDLTDATSALFVANIDKKNGNLPNTSTEAEAEKRARVKFRKSNDDLLEKNIYIVASSWKPSVISHYRLGQFANVDQPAAFPVADNRTRVCVYNKSPQKQNLWIYQIGAIAGYQDVLGDSRMSIYDCDGNKDPNNLLGSTGIVRFADKKTNATNKGMMIVAPIVDADGNPSGVALPKNSHFGLGMTTKQALMISGTDGAASTAANEKLYGKDASNLNPPNDFSNATQKGKGQFTMWAWGETNRPPKVPVNLMPAQDEIGGPKTFFAADFEDANEARGDTIYKYEIELRETKGDKTVLWNPGPFVASAQERKARRIGRRSPVELTEDDTYQWRIRMQDMFEEWSDWTDWTSYRVDTGRITPIVPAAENIDSYFQQTTKPSFIFNWRSFTGSKMAKLQIQISTVLDFTDDKRVVDRKGVNAISLSVPNNQDGTRKTRIEWSQIAPNKTLEEGKTYYYRLSGIDANGKASDWSEIREFQVVPRTNLEYLRTPAQRYRLFCVFFKPLKLSQWYPKLTWIKGDARSDVADYEKETGYNIVFQANDKDKNNGVIKIGKFEIEDFNVVINIGPHRMAFIDEPIRFNAGKSWKVRNNPGEEIDFDQLTWTFEKGRPNTAKGAGPHQVRWNHTGQYLVTCSHPDGTIAKRYVQVLKDRQSGTYDIMGVSGLGGGSSGGWKTQLTIRQNQLSSPEQLSAQIQIQDFQQVGIFCEEEYMVGYDKNGNEIWETRPLGRVNGDPKCVFMGFVQNGSISVDANNHTATFTVGSLYDQLNILPMYSTQTWWRKYYVDVVKKKSEGTINQGSTLDTDSLFMTDVLLHLLQKFTNVLVWHDYFTWHDTSLQQLDTVSTSEGTVWSAFNSLTDNEWASLWVDQGGGLHFESQPGIRSWYQWGVNHPVCMMLTGEDIIDIQVQEQLIRQVSFSKVTGTRPYYPNDVYEGTYPGPEPPSNEGQWQIVSGKMISSTWYAKYIAEALYYDANRIITASVKLPLNRAIECPGRIVISLEIPERNILWHYKEFYVVQMSYEMDPANSTWFTSLQLAENVHRFTQDVPRGEYVNASAVVAYQVKRNGQTVITVTKQDGDVEFQTNTRSVSASAQVIRRVNRNNQVREVWEMQPGDIEIGSGS